jgi:hypothetical protein
MSAGPASAIFTTFIDRKNKREYTSQPGTTSINFNSDMRQFTGAFDFEVEFPRADRPNINSHDFLEFWTYVKGTRQQLGVGFVEDFVKDTSPSSYLFQGNGRDFLARLMNSPFKTRVVQNNYSFAAFLRDSVSDTYLKEYLAYRNRPAELVDRGLYTGPMIFRDVATSPRASVIQEYAELANNLIYQDRLGRMVAYGRDSRNTGRTECTLSGEGDENVSKFIERQNYSKVFSASTIIWAGEENLDTTAIAANAVNSRLFLNTDPRAAGLNQPTMKTFSSQDIVSLGGAAVESRIDSMAKATIRKSNQNLSMPVLTVESPFWRGPKGERLLYETGQIWRLRSQAYGLDAEYKLVGIQYQQNSASLSLQLAFLEPDTLV